MKSGTGLPQSKTWRNSHAGWTARSVLEQCGTPVPLWLHRAKLQAVYPVDDKYVRLDTSFVIGSICFAAMEENPIAQRFPRSSAYNRDWIVAGASGSANPLWLTEWLAEALELQRGMRVLDLGCGRGMSSIFLRREFGVDVWAADLWFSASERQQRIRDAGVEDGVFPIHADARSLPFAAEFFDAIVSIDSFMYYGTDDLYLNYVARFLKPGGLLGIAQAGLMREIEGAPPEHLRNWWTRELWCLHSAAWWKRHWERTEIVDIQVADTMPDGWKAWLDWHKVIAPNNTVEIQAIEADAGRNIGYVRVIGRRRQGVELEEPISSVTMEYTKTAMLRGSE